MNEATLFTAGARLIGLWMVGQAMWEFKTWIDVNIGLWNTPSRSSSSIYLMGGIMLVLVGMFLLFGGHHLARIVCCRPLKGGDMGDAPGETESGDDNDSPKEQGS